MYREVPSRTDSAAHIDNSTTHLSLYRKGDWSCSLLPVPKNANTSMIKWMGGRKFTYDSVWKEACQKCCKIQIHKNNLCEDCGTKSSTLEVIVELSRRELDKIVESDIKLFVLRNPLKRVVSIFFQLLQEVHKGRASFLNLPRFYFKTPHTLPMTLGRTGMDRRFDMFLNSLKDNNFYDAHTFPQNVFLKDRDLTIDDVEVFLFEDLESDINKFCKKYNFTPIPELETINVTRHKLFPGAKEEIDEYVNSNTDIQNKIKEIYKEDWDLYSKIKNSRS